MERVFRFMKKTTLILRQSNPNKVMTNLNFKNLALIALTISILPLISGCSSIAKGVTEAVLSEEKGETVDKRLCEIEGPSFEGIQSSLGQQRPGSPKITKVLMVHGISNHVPGYSSRLQKGLYEKLGLTKTETQIKTIALDNASIKWDKDEPHTLGTLRVTRHTDDNHTRELLFYELTWSPISDIQKERLSFDSANNEGLPRATLNGSLKSFMNATVPDLLIYNGNGYERITTSVKESVCWMLGNNWGDLPEDGAHQCSTWKGSTFANLAVDDHFFITHSLGSRITIDTIQNFGNIAPEYSNPDDEKIQRKISDEIRNKDFTVFMMANQLPLLQMGRDAPEIAGEEKTYCSTSATKADERIMRKMGIVAFSDPNDILSYPVPMHFTSTGIDSRICPSVTNVSLNIAEQKSLFDAASFANPMTAHSGYMEDDRVIELIANGIGDGQASPLIQKSCRWLEITAFDKLGQKPAAKPAQQ